MILSLRNSAFARLSLLVLVLASMLLAVPEAHAQRAFAQRFPAAATRLSVKGDITLIGNTNLTCPNPATEAACINAHNSATTSRNNDFSMVAYNADADGINTNSSRATLAMPSGSTVLFAGLYWASNGGAAPAWTSVRLKTPGGGYSNVTASVTDAIGAVYQSFADVTTLVQGAGNGQYTVGNVSLVGGVNTWAGWTLVVAYRNDTSGTLRNLSVYDGLQQGRTSNPQIDIGISGFYTPPAGPVNSNIGLVVYDGDRGQNDDAAGAPSLLFGPNTSSLSSVFDAINPVADFWNSSISFQGSNVTAGRDGPWINTLGIDIDNVKPNTPLTNGSTSAVVRIRASDTDVNFPGVITLATDVFEPEIVTSFTKTAANDNGSTVFHPGDIVTYTISLTNKGNDNANATQVSDPLPSGVTFVPGSLQITAGANSGAKTDASGDDQAQYNAGTRTVLFNVGTGATAASGGSVAPTESATLSFKVVVNPVANGSSVSNVANVNYVSNTSGLPASGSTAPSTFTITHAADVSVTKTGPATVAPGAPIAYVVTVSSAGPDNADGTTVTDAVPAGITGVSITCTASGGAACPSTAGLTSLAALPIPTFPSGASVVFTISGTAPASPTTLSNSASVATPTGTVDPTPGNNTAGPVVTSVAAAADLSITNAVVTAGPFLPGQNVTYTLVVTNNGPGDANTLHLQDAIPSGMTFVSLTAPAGWTTSTVGSSPNVTAFADGPALASGANVSFTLVLQIDPSTPAGTTLVDTATISSATPDPNPGNNSASASITVADTADLTLSKTLVTAGPFVQGQSIQYTLVVSNAGPSAASNVQLSDTPTNLAFTSVSGAGCTALPCTIAAIASGASATVTVNATISAAGSFDNVATVSSSTVDPNPADNTDTTGNGGTAAPSADLAVTNVLTSSSPAPAGSTVTYTITVTNNGPSAVTGASLTESVPPQLTGVTWSCASGCGTASGSGNVNTLVDLAIGASVTITVTGTAPATTPSTIAAATATVATPAGTVDANPANNSATAPAVPVSSLAIDAIDDAGSSGGASGGTAIASVLGNDSFNGGSATASNVTVSVVTPASTPNVALNTSTGAVTVAAGTPSGTYTISYRICETANASNCDTATATVTVTSATLVANNDAGTANGQTGATAVANVLGNDTLNGTPATTSNVVLSQLSSTSANIALNPSTGAVTVAPGTPAGSYTLTYRICEAINPANCTTATVAVTVTAAVIDAVNDSAGPIEGSAGATAIVNVLGNDTLGGGAATTSNVAVTPATNGPLTLNANGTVDLAPNTPAGTYTLTYTICEQLNPANCDTAQVSVTVSAAVINAVDDAPPAINGATGGTAIPSVLGNDTLGSGAATASNSLLTQVSTTSPAITLDPSTGAVNVAPGTAAGTYTLVYRLCQKLNPTNCDTASVTVTVSAAPIDAVNDASAPVDGGPGANAVVKVLGNDTLNGGAATSSNATLTQVSSTSPAVTLDTATGAVNLAPNTPAGTYTLVYRLCEKLNPANCDNAQVTVNVIAPAIVATNDTGSTRQNTAVTTVVLANDTMGGAPADPTRSVVTIFTAPAHGTATVNANGSVTYTPASNYSGTDSLVYRLCDRVNPTVCANATLALTVTPNAIDAVDQTFNTPQTGPVVINPMTSTTNGGGAPLDPASVTIVNAPSNGTAVVNANGTITYTPNRLFFGTDTFRYRICDRSTPSPICDTATVTIIVAMQAPQLRLVKTVASRPVKVGDLVRYTVIVENTGIAPANNATVVDVPPQGFTYVDGSLSVDDTDDRFGLAGADPLRITGVDVPVGGRATIVYLLRVGAGVGRGTHTNAVSATDATGNTVSNTATADVTVEGDPMTDDSLILGSVFVDANGDGIQQTDEPGLPGVRIASVEGLLIETDVHGRYHLVGIDAQNKLRGRNFILKVDASTLPPGTTFTTPNPLVRRITPGIPVRFDFGVRLPDDGNDASAAATH